MLHPSNQQYQPEEDGINAPTPINALAGFICASWIWFLLQVSWIESVDSVTNRNRFDKSVNNRFLLLWCQFLYKQFDICNLCINLPSPLSTQTHPLSRTSWIEWHLPCNAQPMWFNLSSSMVEPKPPSPLSLLPLAALPLHSKRAWLFTLNINLGKVSIPFDKCYDRYVNLVSGQC